MTRLARTRLSRAIVTLVVVAIVVGAYVEFRRRPKQVAQATVKPPVPAVVTAKPGTPAPTVTRTPAPPVGGIPLYAANPQPPVPAPTPEPTRAPAVTADHVLADAKAKVAANDLLTARKLLNDALVAGGMTDADTAAVKKQTADLQSVLLFGRHFYTGDTLAGTITVPPGANLASIAKQHAVPFELLMQINGMTDAKRLQSGKSLKVINGPFCAVVTKGKFTLDLYLGGPGGAGSTYVASYPVGLGENDSTPTGTWEIKNKQVKPDYDGTHEEGHIPYGDPRNPLGPCWMGLEGTDGHAIGAEHYGIHGTIDPTSIGKMSSQGCVRLRNEDVTVVYKLLVEKKSKVKVVD